MMQSRLGGHYNIQQVADVTGLSKQVIRKWEERYELVQPDRLANGYRIYSEKDVNTFLRVKTLSERGYSIKQAVALVKEEKETLEDQFKAVSPEPYEEFNDFVFQLLEKGSYCDETELNLILQQGYHHFGLEKFLSAVVIPFLHEVGKRWERGEWDEYQESVSSQVVRDFLVQIRRNYQYREEAPLIIAACLPGEHHEVPIHILLLQFMMRGWKGILIGASPARGSIEALVKKLQPKIVLLSASTTTPFELDRNLVTRLDEFASKYSEINFFIGGAGSLRYLKGKNLNTIRLANSIEEVLGGNRK